MSQSLESILVIKLVKTKKTILRVDSDFFVLFVRVVTCIAIARLHRVFVLVWERSFKSQGTQLQFLCVCSMKTTSYETTLFWGFPEKKVQLQQHRHLTTRTGQQKHVSMATPASRQESETRWHEPVLITFDALGSSAVQICSKHGKRGISYWAY